MPVAVVYGPDGAQIGSHARPNARRAALTAKGAQIRQRRLTETEFELVYDYAKGTRVVTGEVVETWDGALWVDQATGLPSEPVAPGTRFVIEGKPHVYTFGPKSGVLEWVPVEPAPKPKRGE